MHLNLLKTALAGAFAASLTTAATADDSADLVALSKSDFLEQAQELFLASFVAQKELLNRLSPGLGDKSVVADPMTDAELGSMECYYDKMAARGELASMAKHLLATHILTSKIETDPAFDFVSFISDEAFIDALSAEVSDEATAAMGECDVLTISQERLNHSPELWAIVGQAAEARGLDQ